jgi:hypothetical protein
VCRGGLCCVAPQEASPRFRANSVSVRDSVASQPRDDDRLKKVTRELSKRAERDRNERSPRTAQQPRVDGQIFMDESLDALRQLVDIAAASTLNREQAEEMGIVDSWEVQDSRTRTAVGRAAILAESKDLATLGSPMQDDNSPATLAVLDRFVRLWT